MSLQFLVDGLLTGSMIGLGAIGVTLTYSILRFSNFAHGDFMAWGAYATLVVVGAIGAMFGKFQYDGLADTPATAGNQGGFILK